MKSSLCPLLLVALAATACGEAMDEMRSLSDQPVLLPTGSVRRVVAGDPGKGRELLARHACTTCHAIPGERRPGAHVGPPLTHFARRTNIGGSLPNEPEVLVRFIMNAPQALPGTGMPNLAVSEAEARHIAALLYTLQ